MSLFLISDLHLSFGVPNKTMSVFSGWENYENRIEAGFKRLVKENDTVIIGGDISWALKLEETYKDFEFLQKLPGKKLLIKGNHDLWWSTATKINAFFKENNFDKFNIIYNNCVVVDDYAVCGTRGWFYDSSDVKILNREAARLDRSLNEALKTGKKPLVVLHYPPVYNDYVCHQIIDVLKKYNITTVYHGHIHGIGMNNSKKEYDGIKFKLISADCMSFVPFQILD